MSKLGECIDELSKMVVRLKVNNPDNKVPEVSVSYLRRKYPEDFDEAWSYLMFKRLQEDPRLTQTQADWVKRQVDDMEDDIAHKRKVEPFYEQKPEVLQKPKARHIVTKGVK